MDRPLLAQQTCRVCKGQGTVYLAFGGKGTGVLASSEGGAVWGLSARLSGGCLGAVWAAV